MCGPRPWLWPWGKGRKRLEFLGGFAQGVDLEPRECKLFFGGNTRGFFLAGGHIGGESDGRGEVRLWEVREAPNSQLPIR